MKKYLLKLRSVVQMNKRPSWDEYFMQLAFLASTRSTCLSRKVGAVIEKDIK